MEIFITSISAGSDREVVVTVEQRDGAKRNAERFLLPISVYASLSLTVGASDTDTFELLEREAYIYGAYKHSLYLLGISSQSKHMLYRKLVMRGFEPEISREAVDRLERAYLLDEDAFATREAEKCLEKHWGEARIRSHLYDKGYREKAIANAKESNAKSGNTLKIGMVSTAAEGKSATAEDDGENKVDTALTVAVKVVAAYSDSVQGGITFNSKGEDTTKHGEITTKRALGDNYGMAKYGQDLNGDGVVKEWYAQAEAFDAALVGKDAAGVAKLVTNGYGDEALQTAGCTIAISDMVKAAVKAVEVK